MVEVVALGVGVVVAKLIARMWVQDAPAESLAIDAVDLMKGRVGSLFEKRAIQRQLDGISDAVAARIAPIAAREWNGLDSAERTAALSAVEESLTAGAGLSVVTLMQADLDADKLLRVVKASSPQMVERAGLGDSGEALYETVLYECCNYVTSIAGRLPGFETAQARALLAKQNELYELMNSVLDALPSARGLDEGGREFDDATFEDRYRKSVKQNYDQVRLFGLTSPTARGSYPLTVAYISLKVETKAPFDEANGLYDGGSGRQAKGSSEGVQVEDLLQGQSHVMLVGDAGSGKTTLVQWIALASIADAESSSLGPGWAEKVPFIVRLRDYVGTRLPSPEQMVKNMVPNLYGGMPDGWAQRALLRGRATLLIDGLDEVSSDERAEVEAWIRSMMGDFPANRWVITSRPSAVKFDFLHRESFTRADLLPMGRAQIRLFIRNWHEAAKGSIGAGDGDTVALAEKLMQLAARERPAIRWLSTSPLLCAMVCAMHLNGGASLPSGRMELYNVAVEMLAYRRDTDRRVGSGFQPLMEPQERMHVLRYVARWMHDNGHNQISRDDFDAAVSRALAGLSNHFSGPGVSQFLLERGGVLREPLPKMVDFIHRSFLEYLVAASFVDDDSIHVLILNSTDDRWREVIILASGHANSVQRATLINGLLDKGDLDRNSRNWLYMLAVACMETSTSLTPEVSDRIAGVLSKVLPPENLGQAHDIASAGPLVVEKLASDPSLTARQAIACVRALSLIGGEDALRVLSTFGRDSRVTVSRELIRAWSSFDANDYAREVLRHSPLDMGLLTVTEPEQIPCLVLMTNLQAVYLDLPNRFRTPDEVPQLPDFVYGVDLSGLRGVGLFTTLGLPYEIRNITLRSTDIRSLEHVNRFRELRYLDLSWSRDLEEIRDDFVGMELSSLVLTGSKLVRIRVHSGFAEESSLVMHSMRNLRSIDAIESLTRLELGNCPVLEDVTGIEASTSLARLSLTGGVGSVSEIKVPYSLTELSIGGNSLRLTGGDGVRILRVHLDAFLANFSWVLELSALTRLEIECGRSRAQWDDAWMSLLRQLARKSSLEQITVLAPGVKLGALDENGWLESSTWSSVRFARGEKSPTWEWEIPAF